jgi:HPt (histidine-containing phosphotransfer) domain-containing protein
MVDNRLEILKDTGLDIKQGLGYTGGEENYISAVQRFYKSYDKNRKKIVEYFDAKDYNSYMITVHALKSNAKMIGAVELSNVFEELEAAAKNESKDVLDTKNNPALISYNKLVESLKPIGEMEEVHPADEISADEAKEVAEQLLSALDDFDDSLAKELAEKLSGYPFRITQRDKLKEATGLIDDFMYDDAADIIKEIYPSIE